jgi:hypothetical protein
MEYRPAPVSSEEVVCDPRLLSQQEEVIAMQSLRIARNYAALPTSVGRLALIVLLGWLAMIGVDFFLHGGLLAGLYLQSDPFLLPPAQAFARIPIGYLSFMLLSGALVWLMLRLGITGGREGALFGLKFGALAWGALVLGLASISTASLALLAGWFAGQTIELAIGGYFVGDALASVSLKRHFRNVILLLVAMGVATIVMQSLGIAPAARIG